MLQYKLEEWKVKVGCQSFLSLISKVLRLVLTIAWADLFLVILNNKMI